MEAKRLSPQELREAILETLQRQSQTTQQGKLLIETFDYKLVDAHNSGREVMDGLLNHCAGNLAQIVDGWITEGIEATLAKYGITFHERES